MADLYIPVILGTGREGRQSDVPARWVTAKFAQAGIETELVDVRDWLESPFTDNSKKTQKAKDLAAKLTRAHGLVVVAPEYNHGYPGELKLLLDTFFPEFGRIPFGICGVSFGKQGGARMVEQLKLVSIRLHMVPVRESMYFSSLHTTFDKEGNLIDAEYDRRIAKFIEEMVWMANAMKAATAASS